MARLTTRQKAGRVLSLLLGLRNPRIAAALVRHGFSNDDLAEGWARLQGITRSRLDTLPGANPAPIQGGPAPLAALDAWRNKWFPIAKATLMRRAPKAHDWIFLDLAHAVGPKIILAVGAFVGRWDLLDKPRNKRGFGPGGKDAKKLLAMRGLDRDVVEEARRLVEALTTGVMIPPDVENAVEDEAAQAAAFQQAEKELWGWYQEWSQIARTVIKDRRQLKALGFLKAGAASSSAEGDDAEDDETESDEEDEATAEDGARADTVEEEEATPPAKPKKTRENRRARGK